MSRDLEDLDPGFLPKAKTFLRLIEAAGIQVTIITTRRTPEEQEDCIRRGTSWTRRSKHLEGLAIDIVPTSLIQEKLWAPKDPLWDELGKISEGCGLYWGGRWKKRPDRCHFEEGLFPKTE